jgi:hypothetical protein
MSNSKGFVREISGQANNIRSSINETKFKEQKPSTEPIATFSED